MGLEDRQYYRSEYDSYQRGGGGIGGQSIVNLLLIANIAVFVVDMFMPQGVVASWLALPADLWAEPWRVYSLLTYGFTHASFYSQTGIWHVAMNMFVLWMFGREVEYRLGRNEFLRFYLVTVVVAGAVWLLYVNLVYGQANGSLVGASGAVMGVFAIFVFFAPSRTLLIWGILPTPAWLLFGVYVVADLVGMRDGAHVAHEAHLAGVGFAALYYFNRWNLGRLAPGSFRFRLPRLRRPNLKVHRPEATDNGEQSYRQLEEEGDRILQKIQTQGEESLTPEERRTLENYSRRMRQKYR